MGHKIHPIGFRIGVIYGWQSRWYADRNYTRLLHEDLRIRRHILTTLADAGISKVEIERSANEVGVTIHTAKPGVVIGRQGAKVEELRQTLAKMTNRKVRVNIQEIRVPELDAYLVARSVADQLERRVAFRRAMKQAVQRTMQRGARGVKIIVAGRLGGAEMGRRETEMEGRVPLHTLRADIDYGFAEAFTTYGVIGVKVWIYKGDILPERKQAPEPEQAVEAQPQIEGTIVPAAALEAARVAEATVAASQPEPEPEPVRPEPVPAMAEAAQPAPVPAAEAAPQTAEQQQQPAIDPFAELARMQEQMRRMQEEMARLQAAAAAAAQQVAQRAAAGEQQQPAAGEEPERTDQER